MDLDRRKTLLLVLAAALFLGALDLFVWVAARVGAIPPINDTLLWSTFAALCLVAIPWAISQLGLQPLVISLSYVAGGFIAFRGLQGVAGIHVAEVTTAGATYGAFGAMAVGHAAHKVRLAFFDRRQSALMFVILSLLAFMALLNSEIIGSMNSSVMLNAVVLPLVLSGMLVSLGWTACSHIEKRRSSGKPLREPASSFEATEERITDQENTTESLVFQMPDEAGDSEEAPAEIFIPQLTLPEEVLFEEDELDEDKPVASAGCEASLPVDGTGLVI